jgi:tritrans,polycis-undecaprenyl-diphosphate synthase [geranylgeranyl-diphosphate specific]
MTLERVPRHIGIILDGNRRFAKKLMLKPWMGHEWGAKKLRQFLDWCRELGIKEVTAYTLSIQNFDRPKEEFDYLMKLFLNEFTELMQSAKVAELKQKGIRITFIGRVHLFPQPVQAAMHKLMELTKDNTPYRVNFAMAYGGREEVIDAVKKLGKDVQKGKLDIDAINEEVFGKYLYINADPDLIIRTGGEKRTSNFLPWQGIYSEWFFIDKPWPEFEKADLVTVLEEFQQRERRFGR